MKSQKINREYYNRNAESWADRKPNSFWHETRFIRLIKYFKPGDRILDLGCAYAIHVPLFLGIGRHLKYEGMDISSSMLKIARRRYPQLKFYLGDIMQPITFPAKKYDGLWAAATLMHIPKEDWPVMLKNLQKLIKPGGIGFIELPRRRPNAESDSDRRIFSNWTPTQLKAAIGKFGWKVLSHGLCENKDNNAGWWWAIVQLPKRGMK